ncbi:MAG: hypothetical protein ABJC04_03925 [Verrucomicrobiota bacterium]
MTTTWFKIRQLPALLRGDTTAIRPWIKCVTISQTLVFLAVIAIGVGSFGAAIGYWRAPQQAFYSAIKLPLVILLTTFGNALLNGMLAPLLGLNIGFRQSLLLILMSFVIAASILGSFSPVVVFMIWNLPSISSDTKNVGDAYGFMQLALAGIIAFAGIMANWRLFPLLREQSGKRAIATRVLFSWLAGNLFLGSQICWMLRPFVGNPDMPVEFLGAGLQQGNFFETIFRAVKHLLIS